MSSSQARESSHQGSSHRSSQQETIVKTYFKYAAKDGLKTNLRFI